MAESNPPESPYEYKTGDYFIVGTVASGGGTNYKPNGASYTTGVASTTVETAEVSVDDVYYYDGTNWRLQNNTQKTLAFVNIAGSPYDNTNLANALNSKVSTTTTVNGKALSSNITLGTDDIEAGNYGVSLTYFVDFFVNANNSFGECIGGVFDDEGTFSKASYQTETGWNLNNIADNYTIVEAIGWCDRSIGKISTLTTTVKTDLVSALNETQGIANGAIQGVQVGGTDLTPDANKKVNIPKAAQNVLGVVQQYASGSWGVILDSNGYLKLAPASETSIKNRSNGFMPITISNLDIAIREGLGNNTLTWTDAYKESARNTVGASRVSFVHSILRILPFFSLPNERFSEKSQRLLKIWR